MKSLQHYLLRSFLFGFIVLFSSCSKQPAICDCFKSTGSDIRQDRPAPAFTNIQVESKVDVVLTQDTIERIYVVAGKHLIDKIETSVSGGTLYIRNHNICNFVRSLGRQITVYVSVRHLNTINYDGAGNVTCTNTLRDSCIDIESHQGSGSVTLDIQAQVIHATIHTGPADIRVTGSTPLLYVYSGGNGVIHAEAIACPQIYLTEAGTGTLYAATDGSANSLLDYEIDSFANVYFRGHPATIQEKLTSTGRLIFF
ncbi:MAG: GIN domain-containing protein [Bacteroidia bacterium]